MFVKNRTLRLKRTMEDSDLLKQSLCILSLPDDLLHRIFSQLSFRVKIKVGLVCKHWEQLLQDGTAGARHWEVVYDVSKVACSRALATSVGRSPQQLSAVIGRWFAKRAPAIKYVCLLADVLILNHEEQAKTQKFLDFQLPTLAACLSKHAPELAMEIEFAGVSPFDSPLLSSPAVLTLLCPMLRWLTLWENEALISPAQFAAICQLTRLEQLEISDGVDISGFGAAPGGLQALTSDISKLVNLRVLDLDVYDAVGYRPESISGLQKLERLTLRNRLDDIDLAIATDLAGTRLAHHNGVSTAPRLQGLKSLSEVALTDQCLELVPWDLCSLSALTSLDVRNSETVSQWLSTTLSRLTKLAELTIRNCEWTAYHHIFLCFPT